MTAEPRDVEEIRRDLAILEAAKGRDSDEIHAATIRLLGDAEARLAAADRENAELRKEVERLRRASFTQGQEVATYKTERDAAERALERLSAELADARAAIASYEHRISWDTTCENCARLLDVSMRDYERADRAERALEAVRTLCDEAETSSIGWIPESLPDVAPLTVVRTGELRAALSAAPQSEPVHNHGPAEGAGLDCPEWTTDGALRGACLAPGRPWSETDDADPACCRFPDACSCPTASGTPDGGQS